MSTKAKAPRNLDFLTTNEIPICSDAELTAADFAALELAGRQFAKVRDELDQGDYKIWRKLVIHGGISIGKPVEATTPADYLGVLAWVLARLPAPQRAAVASAVRDGIQVNDGQRDIAKAVCEPTKGTTQRRGALTGIISVDIVED